ncbi:MAG: gamma carbonic anhydrase family protein [Defluviitaleaceae bacterium]|nr:gamma carbonic anhydrase family protein [Defluviitaleaceae bacterium]
MANIITFDGKTPNIHKNTFLAVSVDIIGDVTLEEGVSIWNNSTIRGDMNSIRIGKYTNIQDNSVVHVDTPHEKTPHVGPTVIGEYVTIGHGAIIHACTLEDACLIGMGAIILDGAVVGKGTIVGAGAVVPPHMVIPPYSMVLGVPGKVIKSLPEESLEERIAHAKRYWERTSKY